jgi:hypothetical protein
MGGKGYRHVICMKVCPQICLGACVAATYWPTHEDRILAACTHSIVLSSFG